MNGTPDDDMIGGFEFLGAGRNISEAFAMAESISIEPFGSIGYTGSNNILIGCGCSQVRTNKSGMILISTEEGERSSRLLESIPEGSVLLSSKNANVYLDLGGEVPYKLSTLIERVQSLEDRILALEYSPPSSGGPLYNTGLARFQESVDEMKSRKRDRE